MRGALHRPMMTPEVGVTQVFASEIIHTRKKEKKERRKEGNQEETLENINNHCIVREHLATRKRNSLKETKLKEGWSYGHNCRQLRLPSKSCNLGDCLRQLFIRTTCSLKSASLPAEQLFVLSSPSTRSILEAPMVQVPRLFSNPPFPS